jgi:N-acetylglutamate synthase-like GNAT family acetyltransferase
MPELVGHGSGEYEESVALRHEVLRKPLGLSYDPAELAGEKDSFHLALREGLELVACLVLKPLDERCIKMRQLAVRESSQGKGFGRELVNHAESFAREQGYAEIFLHARETARGFYEKLGYQVEGNPFTEVGLPHLAMRKKF